MGFGFNLGIIYIILPLTLILFLLEYLQKKKDSIKLLVVFGYQY